MSGPQRAANPGRLAAAGLSALGLLLPAAAQATVAAQPTVWTFSSASTESLQQLINGAAAGDTIDITAGTYFGQTATIDTPLTITGHGGMATLDAVAANGTNAVETGNQMGILVINANVTIQNLVLENAVADTASNNGAGIRYQAGNLTIDNSQFLNNQDGILATPNVYGTGTVEVSHSTFDGNGVASGPGAGYAHALYANHVALLQVTDSSFTNTQQGHDIKSRAADSIIKNNYLEDGVTGTASYAIDLSNGGNATISGNTIDQGPNTTNWSMIAYDSEGLVYAQNNATIDNNVFNNEVVNNASIADATGVMDFASTRGDTGSVLTVSGNTFSGVANPVCGGPAVVGSNTYLAAPPSTCAAVPAPVPAPPGLAVVATGLLPVLLARRWRPIDAGRTGA